MMGAMQRNLLIGVAVLLVVAAILAKSVLYTVNERELAVIVQFGEPVAARTEPGLYFKVPFVQDVLRLPKTKQFWSAGESDRLIDLPTADGKKIEVTPWAVWRITDPQQFVKVLRTRANAEARIQTIARSAVRDVITQYDLIEAIRSTDRELTYSLQVQDFDESSPPTEQAPGAPKEPEQAQSAFPGAQQRVRIGREEIVAEIKQLVDRELQQSEDGAKVGRGIELVDVGISRIDFVPQVREAAFDRLIAFMESIAARYLNEGERRKQEILNRAKADVQRIEGEGSQEANKTKGDVDAAIIDMYAEAINETGEFYNFIRTLEAYQEALAGNTNLILTTDSEFFRLLKQAQTAPIPVKTKPPQTSPADSTSPTDQ